MEQITEKQFNAYLKEEPTWYRSLRQVAFQRMKQLPMPSFRYGLSILIKPESFDFANLGIPSRADNNILISKQDGIEIAVGSTMPETAKSFEEESEDKLLAYHTAFANEFIVIKIQKTVKKPVEIKYDLRGSTISTIMITSEPNAKAKIILMKSSKSLPSSTFNSEHILINAGAGSSIEFISTQNLSRNVVNVQHRTAICQKDATVNWTELCLGTIYTRAAVSTRLVGQGASTKNLFVFHGTDKQRFDIFTASYHDAPDTLSNIITRGVLNQESKGLSRGLVKIAQNAAGSNGYEQQDVLLLSEHAEADAIPNLEIDNNDVKCSHGSTVGQIDEEKIFYLQSRGLSREQAVQQIVLGYFMPIVELCSDQEIREKLYEVISKEVAC